MTPYEQAKPYTEEDIEALRLGLTARRHEEAQDNREQWRQVLATIDSLTTEIARVKQACLEHAEASDRYKARGEELFAQVESLRSTVEEQRKWMAGAAKALGGLHAVYGQREWVVSLGMKGLIDSFLSGGNK